MRVLKFGGSSLADAERFLRVSDIVVNNQQQVQVALVLSAPAKVTNLLVALVSQTSKGEDATATLDEIEGIFTRLITGLKARYANLADDLLMSRLNDVLGALHSKMQGIQLLGQCPDSVQAFILSRGEALSIACMEQLLLARAEKVTLINPVEMLLAEGSYLESHVDIDVSRERFAEKGINEGHIYLMAGFTGGNAKGELVLLGRNGSDYSAAVLAACVNADCCEIWTDVDGVYSCDPRLVPDAVLLKRMSYKEAMELSYFGAKVLHPRTIAPIARFHIPCLIKNTFNPQGEGTLISADHGDDQYPVKGISDLAGISMINVSVITSYSIHYTKLYDGVVGLSHILLDTPLNDLQRQYLNTIHLSAVTLGNIFNDIIDLDKIERRKLKIARSKIDLRMLFSDLESYNFV